MMMMMMIKGTTCLIIDNMQALVGHLALCSNATKPFIWRWVGWMQACTDPTELDFVIHRTCTVIQGHALSLYCKWGLTWGLCNIMLWLVLAYVTPTVAVKNKCYFILSEVIVIILLLFFIRVYWKLNLFCTFLQSILRQTSLFRNIK